MTTLTMRGPITLLTRMNPSAHAQPVELMSWNLQISVRHADTGKRARICLVPATIRGGSSLRPGYASH
jgi:hypothetical protein